MLASMHILLYESPGGNQVDGLPPAAGNSEIPAIVSNHGWAARQSLGLGNASFSKYDRSFWKSD